MKRILGRLAWLGIVAAGALGASVATSWSCAPGSTDCPMDAGPRGWGVARPDMPVERPGRPDIRPGRPDWRPDVRPSRPDWRPDPDRGRPDWRSDDRPGRPHWRPDRDNRPRFDRHRPPRDPDRWRGDRWRDKGWRYWQNGGIYLNFDIDRYMPDYYDDYYDDPRPRYRVRLSAAHIEWCHARYKTYRVSDNTFKPTRHTRRLCISPYS